MGFLSKQSVRMIVVEALQDIYNSTSFSFPGIFHMAVSMPFTQSGPLRKMVIAAKYNVSVHVGWPELQIIREANNSYCIAFATNTTEPKPTGYLNLYEYDLTATNFNIQPGDKLNISWRGNALQPDQIRFSLAYDNYGASPMVSVVVGDYSSEPDLLILNRLHCEEITPTANVESVAITESFTSTPATKWPITSNKIDSFEAVSDTSAEASTTTGMIDESVNTASTNQFNASTNETVIISGVVVFSLLLLIVILLFLVVFILYVVKQRRKSASPNAIDSTEMNRYANHPQMPLGTPSKSIHFDNSNVYLAIDTLSSEGGRSSFRK